MDLATLATLRSLQGMTSLAKLTWIAPIWMHAPAATLGEIEHAA